MNPCSLNAAIAALTNHLYSTLSEKAFLCLALFLSELSKSMFSMSIFRDICGRQDTAANASQKLAAALSAEESE